MEQQQIEQILSKMEFEMKIAIKPDQVEPVLTCLKEQHALGIMQHYVSGLVQDSPMFSAWANYITPQLDKLSGLSCVQEQTLSNEYFDTVDDALFHNFSAGLRLRRSSLFEGVEQTIKLKGLEQGAAHSHLEFNVRTLDNLTCPNLDLFKDDEVPEQLKDPKFQAQLQGKYKTDFKRITGLLEIPLIGKVELALDEGTISSQKHATAISEMELELKELDPACFSLPTVNQNGLVDYDLEDLKMFLVHQALCFVKSLNTKLLESNPDAEVFGLEPFSKLKRAVLLKLHADFEKFLAANPHISVDQALSSPLDTLPEQLQALLKQLKIDLSYREQFEQLKQKGEYNPDILEYIACGKQIMLSLFDACGKVKLFGTARCLKDLQVVLNDCSDFVQESWFFKDGPDNAWDESWGICSLFKRQSFWGGLARRFMILAEDLKFAVDGVLEEQHAPESDIGPGTLPFSGLFYSKNPFFCSELPLLVHFTAYSERRYRKLLELDPQSPEFAKLLKSTSDQLSLLFDVNLVKQLLSSPCDTEDIQRLFW